MLTISQRMRSQPLAWRARIASLNARECGSVAIETAVSFMLMITCVLGIIGFTLMLYTYCVYQEAARNGVRYALVHGLDSSNCSGPSLGCGDPTAAHVVSAVTGFASPYAAPISGMSIQVSYPDSGGCTPPSRVIVTITYTYTPPFHVIANGIAFQVSSQGRILY